MSSSSRAQIVFGTFVDAPTPDAVRIRENHVAVVSEKGRIVHLAACKAGASKADLVKELPEEYRQLPTLEMKKSQFVTPGFVDCHNQCVCRDAFFLMKDLEN
jgi:guanine deaminase